jgi:3-mercaptopyruvate sulfurtransferase SseA
MAVANDDNRTVSQYAHPGRLGLHHLERQDAAIRAFKDDVLTHLGKPMIDVCSSHTWFALTHLLGFRNVRNVDGSRTEWGNAVRVPIEACVR